jgi:pimeloyl-ACP methyl ester carboxylesterase
MGMPNRSHTLVFITGAFVTHHGWDEWLSYFENRGYNCIAPAWPFKDGSPQELRDKHAENNPGLAGLRLKQLLDHYIAIIKKLPEKPIVIGHSMGGLIVQLLINRGLVAGGVAIHSVPPKGILSFEWSFLKSVWKPLGFFTSVRQTYLMSFEGWQYAFTNGMTLEQQRKSYEENVTPESKRIMRDTLSKTAKVDFDKPHVPLLFISGTADHIMPASINYSNYRRYNSIQYVTGYKEFEGKNHFVLGMPSWQEEADYISEWIQIVNI